MRILVIVGGTSDPSNSEMLARSFADGAKNVPGTEVDIVTLRDLHIDHFIIKHYDQGAPAEPDFAMIKQKIESADGLVFASPIWNFGIPANFKNLLDRCGAFGLDAKTRSTGQWKGKPFFLIFTGGSPHAAWTGLQRGTTSFVPTALKYFGASHAGTHYEPRSMKGKGQFGLIVDQRPESLAAVKQKGEAFARITKTYAETGKLPATQTFMRLFYRLGQFIQRKFI